MKPSSKVNKSMTIIGATVGIGLIVMLIYILWPGRGPEKKYAYSFIPNESAMVFRINNGGVFADSLLSNSKSHIPIEIIPLISEWKTLYNNFDQSYSRTGNPVREWIRNGCWYLTLLKKNGKTQVLFIREFNENEDQKLILTNLLQGAYKNETIKDKGDGFYELQDSLGHKLSFTLCDENFIGSFDATALDYSMEVHKNGNNLDNNPLFAEAHRVADKQALFNVFVNFESINQLVSEYLKAEHAKNIEFVANLGKWAELDVFTNANSISFSGLFSIKDQQNSAMNLFNNQAVTETKYEEILPDNIIYCIRFSFNEYNDFTQKYFTQFEIDTNDTNQFLHDIRAIIGKSFSRFGISDSKGSLIHFAAFSLNDEVIIDELQIGKILNIGQDKEKNEVFRGLKIHDFDIKNISSLLGGRLFFNCPTGCWTLYKNYLLFAADQSKMQLLLNRLLSGKTFYNAPYYETLKDKLSERGSVTIIISPAGNPGLVSQLWFEDSVAKQWQNSSINSAIQAIGISMTMDGDRCLLSGTIIFGESASQQNNGWQTQVDGEISCGPWILAFKDNYYVLVQDTYNNLYLISDQGEVIWKNAIDEQIEGKVYAIEHGNSPAFAFATSHQIILMNIKGEVVKPFPIIHKEGFCSGLTLVDYDHNKQYRLMIVSKSGSMLNYQISGKATSGWLIPKTKHRENTFCRHIKLKGVDYLTLNDYEGNLSLINRTGKLLFTIDKMHGSNSGNQIGYNDKEGLIYTSDQSGNIISINLEGKKSVIIPGSYTQNHGFSIADLDNDGQSEFIIVDEGIVNVIKKEGKIILKQNITESRVNTIQIETYGGSNLILLHAQDGDVVLLNGMQIVDWCNNLSFPTGAVIFAFENNIHLFGAEGNKVSHVSNN